MPAAVAAEPPIPGRERQPAVRVAMDPGMAAAAAAALAAVVPLSSASYRGRL
jgi:hypothetical protein